MEDWQHIKLTYITHFYCNQDNINSVLELLEKYAGYPQEILDQVQFIIVDDGSPISYEIPDFNLNLHWLRIDDDIAWNQGGARNLGVTYAKSDKILITDLDHSLPPETFAYLINHRNPGRDFYKIYRTNPETGEIYKGHSNLFFMSRARFMRHFGYDEEFSGGHGGEDYRFVKYHKYHGSRQRYLPKKYTCYEQEVNRDKAYHSLVRDQSRNTPIDLKKKQQVSEFGAEHGHSRMFLNFRWHTAARFSRPAPAQEKHTLWRHLWWFRWLFSSLAK